MITRRGGLVACAVTAVATGILTLLVSDVGTGMKARKLADDVIEARTRQRTIEVRRLKVDTRTLPFGSRSARAFEVRDTAAGVSWLVLALGSGDPGMVLPMPAAPSRITDLLPDQGSASK